MNKSFRRVLSSLLTAALISSLLCVFAFAAVPPSDDPTGSAYLDDYGVTLIAFSGGNVNCVVDVSAVVNATLIGAKDIYIYEGTSSSGSFTQVAHYNYLSNSDMVGTGYAYSGTPVIYPGTIGKYYYASVYFYAGDSTGGSTRHLDSNVVKAHA